MRSTTSTKSSRRQNKKFTKAYREAVKNDYLMKKNTILLEADNNQKKARQLAKSFIK